MHGPKQLLHLHSGCVGNFLIMCNSCCGPCIQMVHINNFNIVTQFQINRKVAKLVNGVFKNLKPILRILQICNMTFLLQNCNRMSQRISFIAVQRVKSMAISAVESTIKSTHNTYWCRFLGQFHCVIFTVCVNPEHNVPCSAVTTLSWDMSVLGCATSIFSGGFQVQESSWPLAMHYDALYR